MWSNTMTSADRLFNNSQFLSYSLLFLIKNMKKPRASTCVESIKILTISMPIMKLNLALFCQQWFINTDRWFLHEFHISCTLIQTIMIMIYYDIQKITSLQWTLLPYIPIELWMLKTLKDDRENNNTAL